MLSLTFRVTHFHAHEYAMTGSKPGAPLFPVLYFYPEVSKHLQTVSPTRCSSSLVTGMLSVSGA